MLPLLQWVKHKSKSWKEDEKIKKKLTSISILFKYAISKLFYNGSASCFTTRNLLKTTDLKDFLHTGEHQVVRIVTSSCEETVKIFFIIFSEICHQTSLSLIS